MNEPEWVAPVISESHSCYLCRGFLHVEEDLLLAETMIIRVELKPRQIVPVHPWCKRQRLDEYEGKVTDPQAVFARKP